MAVKRRGRWKRPAGSLSAGRPPNIHAARTMKRRSSRALINEFHALQKRRSQAAGQGDEKAGREATARIQALGGLEMYQQASLQGQRRDRGGDTSRVLLTWLHPAQAAPVRMLEVGALSATNACAASSLFETVRIDLHSREAGILQQDYMCRPLPRHDTDRFDVVSLSLVLNFVPDAAERGEMLRRTGQFLRHRAQTSSTESAATKRPPYPCLFVVLPRNCVANSRYFSDQLFGELMQSLGFDRVRVKMTIKLAYYLWAKTRSEVKPVAPFPKREVNPGSNRNNFTIVLKEIDDDDT